MSDTVLDLLTDSAIDLNAISQGQLLSNEDAQTLLRALNKAIDSANAERLIHYGIAKETYPLTANKGSYTIGKVPVTVPPTAPADIDEDRPILIQTSSIVINGIRHPLNPKTAVQFAAIREPGKIAELPEDLYCDYNWPVATLNLNPVPKCTNPTSIEAYVWLALPKFVALTDPVNLPPAYSEWLELIVAVRAAPKFLKQPSPVLLDSLARADARVRSFNQQQLAGMLGESVTGTIPQSPAPAVNPLMSQPPAQG